MAVKWKFQLISQLSSVPNLPAAPCQDKHLQWLLPCHFQGFTPCTNGLVPAACGWWLQRYPKGHGTWERVVQLDSTHRPLIIIIFFFFFFFFFVSSFFLWPVFLVFYQHSKPWKMNLLVTGGGCRWSTASYACGAAARTRQTMTMAMETAPKTSLFCASHLRGKCLVYKIVLSIFLVILLC